MTSILVIQHGDPWLSLASTSLIKGLFREHHKVCLDWATSAESYQLFQHNSRIRDLLVGYGPFYKKYDIAINMTPEPESCKTIDSIESDKRIGFGIKEDSIFCYNKESEEGYNVLLHKVPSDRHILQILFRIAGLRWRGDGYGLSYFPKNKMKRGKTGIAISNDLLRRYVKENLDLKKSDMWHVPLKQDLLKRIDEINRCKRIVTDDLFTAHAAIAMKKHVEFLDTEDHNIKMEFFGNGNQIRLQHGEIL